MKKKQGKTKNKDVLDLLIETIRKKEQTKVKQEFHEKYIY